jgi:hypothetical protein
MKSVRKLFITTLAIVLVLIGPPAKQASADEGDVLATRIERCSGHVRVITINPGNASDPGFTIKRDPNNIDAWTAWSINISKISPGQVKWFCWPRSGNSFSLFPVAEYSDCPSGTDKTRFRLGPDRKVVIRCID